MKQTDIIFTENVETALHHAIERLHPDRLFIIVPKPLSNILLPALNIPNILSTTTVIMIAEGEEYKTLEAVQAVWKQMICHSATRHSLIINLGGGLTSDLGGYAAACYMRGIKYINIPTTLLACVDAAYGGKTAVNLDGIKNIIGAFHLPSATIISPQFLSTLSTDNLLSGWAEMLKHALLSNPEAIRKYLNTNPLHLTSSEWLSLIEESVQFKKHITSIDPHEKGLRRILNLGHTTGHALEALSLAEPELPSISHGHAVAIGLVTALVISHLHFNFDTTLLHQIAKKIQEWYHPFPFSCKHYDYMLQMMHHDKKNNGDSNVQFVLLSAPGIYHEAIEIQDGDIRNALDITRDLLGL